MLILDGDDRTPCGLGAWPGRDPHREHPLACLREGVMASRFHAWHGRSGERYLATVYPIDPNDPADCLPDLGPAVLLAVARRGTARVIVDALVVERGSDWTRAVTWMHPDADEWHVHLLAADRSARNAVLADLDVPRHRRVA